MEIYKLNQVCVNYQKIINKNLPYKFSYLKDWKLKESKLLLKESSQYENKDIKRTHKVYKRGTIIKADFGVNLGSEMSQIHFAIVLNNYDNQNNNVLTVVPLTSKKSKYNLDLKNLVTDKLISKTNEELINIGLIEEFKLMAPKLHMKANNKIDQLYTILSYYKLNAKNTFACCSLITTISKSRIFKPINEYDFVGKMRCSSDVMDKIDYEIINKFTKSF